MKSALLTLALLTALLAPHTAAAQSAPRRIEIHAKRFAFQPAEITLKKGETVTLALTSDDVAHSLLIEGLHVNAAITKGHTSEVTITPTTAGDFPGRCGRFCGSGHGHMTFLVHVVN
ncbi:MAG: cupredoxin domain-containing protein [Terracidiphilus sp.]|jgi:cytochrome c oxidase subunit 2